MRVRVYDDWGYTNRVIESMCRLHIKETKIGLTDSTFLRVLNLLEKRFFFSAIPFLYLYTFVESRGNKTKMRSLSATHYFIYVSDEMTYLAENGGLEKIFERIIFYFFSFSSYVRSLFFYYLIGIMYVEFSWRKCVSMCKRQFTDVKENIR